MGGELARPASCSSAAGLRPSTPHALCATARSARANRQPPTQCRLRPPTVRQATRGPGAGPAGARRQLPARALDVGRAHHINASRKPRRRRSYLAQPASTQPRNSCYRCELLHVLSLVPLLSIRQGASGDGAGAAAGDGEGSSPISASVLAQRVASGGFMADIFRTGFGSASGAISAVRGRRLYVVHLPRLPIPVMAPKRSASTSPEPSTAPSEPSDVSQAVQSSVLVVAHTPAFTPAWRSSQHAHTHTTASYHALLSLPAHPQPPPPLPAAAWVQP